jgi:hypothetical protein
MVMIIIPFPGCETPDGSYRQHSRRRAHSPRSLHIYRRALLRRLGVSSSGTRPACVMDAIARELLAARIAS